MKIVQKSFTHLSVGVFGIKKAHTLIGHNITSNLVGVGSFLFLENNKMYIAPSFCLSPDTHSIWSDLSFANEQLKIHVCKISVV